MFYHLQISVVSMGMRYGTLMNVGDLVKRR